MESTSTRRIGGFGGATSAPQALLIHARRIIANAKRLQAIISPIPPAPVLGCNPMCVMFRSGTAYQAVLLILTHGLVAHATMKIIHLMPGNIWRAPGVQLSFYLLKRSDALTDTDETLVIRSQRGDRAAFEELVRRLARLLFARIYPEVGDVHRA